MNSPIVETIGLKRYYTIRSGAFGSESILKAVDGVNLSLFPGETLGIAGESGCGKSTLGKLLINLLSPSEGHVLFQGQPVTEIIREQPVFFRRQVQMIFQDPYSSLNPRMQVGEIIGEPLKIHRLAPQDKLRDHVVELMARVGLSKDHYTRYPHEFSGGQRQRIGIARALAVSPRVIIADEPVSALDLSIQAQIMNLLQDLQAEMKLSYVFIAHDLSVVRHMSDRIAVMYLGKVVETGQGDQVFHRCLHPYTEALLSAVPQVVPGKRKERIVLKGDLPSPINQPQGCPFHPRCPHARPPLCTEVHPPLEEKEPGHQAACHYSRELYR